MGRTFKGTAGGEAISFSGCEDAQTSADTAVSASAANCAPYTVARVLGGAKLGLPASFRWRPGCHGPSCAQSSFQVCGLSRSKPRRITLCSLSKSVRSPGSR